MPLPSSDGDRLLAQLLLDLNLAAPDEVERARAEQCRRRSAGQAVRIGQLLAEGGSVSAEQIDTALRSLGSGRAVCPRCGGSFPLPGPAVAPTDPSNRCPGCGATLSSADLAEARNAIAEAASAAPVAPRAGPPGLTSTPADQTLTAELVEDAPALRAPTPAPRAGVPAPAGATAHDTVANRDFVPPPSAGHAAPAVPAPPGHQFGKYSLVSELGHGGMGVVYKAYHPGLKSFFAIKVLLAGPDAPSEAMVRFRREAEAAARLSHPGIVAVHDIGEVDGRTYIAMEYVEGATLKEVLDDPPAFGFAPAPRLRAPARAAAPAGSAPAPVRPGRAWGLPGAVAARMTRDIAAALSAAHESGVVHRDLKPANVLRDRSGRLKVMDFGLARLVDAGQTGATKSGDVMGTPAYMSPEQAEGRVREVDAVSDVYQLGAILYELLTGRAPYEGDTTMEILLQVLLQDPPPPRRLIPGMDRDVETICLKCLSRERARRYPSAAALAADLGRYLDGEPIEARRISTITRLVMRALRHKRVVLPSVALVVLLVAGVVSWAVARATRRREIDRGLAAGRRLLAAGQPGDARDEYRGVLERDAANNEAENGLALAEAELGRIEGERRRAAEALAAAKAQAEAQARADGILLRAEVLWREARDVLYRPAVPVTEYRTKLAQALALYDQALAAASNYGWIYESRARVRLSIGDLAGAQADLAQAYTLLGTEHGKAARRSLGRVYLERALALVFGSADSRPARDRQAENWRGHALAELEASAGEIEWRGPQGEAECARRLADGFAAWMRGDRPRAEAVLRPGAEQGHDEECAWALAVIAPAESKEESDWLARALELCARHARTLLMRGIRRKAARDLAGARADHDVVLAIAPELASAWLSRGEVRELQADPEGALADYGEAIRRDPALAAAYTDRGVLRQACGDLPGARADAERALALDPQDPVACFNRGQARLAQGDVDGALADYTEAIRLNPRYAKAYNCRGVARRRQGDEAGAAADVAESARLAPEDPRALVNRGVLRAAQGDAQGALADYARALELEPGLAVAFYNRGVLRRDLKDLRGALADFDQAVRLAPDDADAWNDRAATRARLGDPDGAIADLSETIRRKPRFLPARFNRALLRQKQGDLAGARDDFAEAVRIDPRCAAAYVGRAQTRLAQGDRAGGVADYEKALEVAPAAWPQRKQVEAALAAARGGK